MYVARKTFIGTRAGNVCIPTHKKGGMLVLLGVGQMGSKWRFCVLRYENWIVFVFAAIFKAFSIEND